MSAQSAILFASDVGVPSTTASQTVGEILLYYRVKFQQRRNLYTGVGNRRPLRILPNPTPPPSPEDDDSTTTVILSRKDYDALVSIGKRS